MPKTHRLTGRDLRSSRPVRRMQGALFSLSILPLSAGAARCTVVVSKKVAATAVARNLIKRRAREAARGALRDLPSMGLILTAKREAARAGARDVASDVKVLLSKIRSVQ